eukprot:gnl/MRDRNA2_/MRDRNA2_102092_c0_seq1.p1 gnl/MRDRNA2_/MRDRNA2_102092_c0~~gnl/MRDRNA2_/MRDRNA2_102092_c0_seq1.p1  ORF type:complete len:410 (+),score=111.58 gnl/MRDRNA2_/MRDRNA2_102092_c0_seq1:105-1232(+)
MGDDHPTVAKRLKELEDSINGLAARLLVIQKSQHEVSVEADDRCTKIERRLGNLHEEHLKTNKLIESNKAKVEAEIATIEKTRLQQEKHRNEQHEVLQKAINTSNDSHRRFTGQQDHKWKTNNEKLQELSKKLDASADTLQGKFEALAAEQRAQEARTYSSAERIRADMSKGLAEERQKASDLFAELQKETQRLGLEKNQVQMLAAGISKLEADRGQTAKVRADLETRERHWAEMLAAALSEQRTWAEGRWGELQEHLDVAIMGVDDRAVNLLSKLEQLCLVLMERIQADSEERRKWKDASLRNDLEAALSWASDQKLLRGPGKSWGSPQKPGYVSGYPGEGANMGSPSPKSGASVPTMMDSPVLPGKGHWMGLM